MPAADAQDPSTAAVAAVPYRCVCGATAAVRQATDGSAGGGVCPGCGRRFAGSVLDDAGAATVSLPRAPGAGTAGEAPAGGSLGATLPADAGVAFADPDLDPAATPGGGYFAEGVLPDPPADFPPARPDPAAPDDPDATVVAALGKIRPPAVDRRPTDLPAGTELEHFRIEAPLGRGGMGAVYRALDLSLQRYVAVKVIGPDAARAAPAAASAPAGSAPAGTPGPGTGSGTGSAALDRLMQEARAQARVNHPNVAHIYFVSPDPAEPFLAMELIDGPTLAEVLKRGPLPYGIVTRVGLQISRALACAARFDIVHGDVKPSNALLAGPPGDRAAVVKLSDFGLARRTGGAAAAALEGTPNYLAPEVVRGGPPTAKSDLYALGVTLFETTFGRLPYSTPTQGLSQRLTAHLSAAPEFPEPWPAALPPEWRDFLASLLAKDPADRPADADAVAAEIAGLSPQSSTRAGLLVRSLAWAADLGLVSIASAILLGGVALPVYTLVRNFSSGLAAFAVELPMAALTVGLGFVPSLVLAWRQARTGRTPGKALFQVRVVDRYGLKPARRVLFSRALAQTFPVWGTIAVSLSGDLTGQEWLETGLELGVLAAFLADLAPAPFRRDRRTLHDLILGTGVVLDTGPTRRRDDD